MLPLVRKKLPSSAIFVGRVALKSPPLPMVFDAAPGAHE
jgi:hypothetical protein